MNYGVIIILDKSNKYRLLNNPYDKSSYDFYFYNEKLNPTFRIINPLRKVNDTEYEQIFYPYWILQSKEKASEYCTEKFKRLNEYLKQNKPFISNEELMGMSEKDREKFLELKKKSVKSNM